MLRLPCSINQTLVGLVALASVGCSTTITAKYPHLERRSVCRLVPGIDADSTQFIFTTNNIPVSNLQPELVEEVAPTARTVFELDPNVDIDSVRYLPTPYNELTCPERFSILPSGKLKASPLPEASLDLLVYKPPTETNPVPQPIAQQLASCPSASAGRLGAIRYAMDFNVYIDEKNATVSAYMKKSTLGDENIAICMLEALRKTQWPAPEASSAVTFTPGSKLFLADGPSNLPNVQDLLNEVLRKTPSTRPPVGTPGAFGKPYYVLVPLGPLFVGITVGVSIFLAPRDTAPSCASELNPITRRPYTTLEECEEVKRLSPEEILKRQLAHIKATQPQAPPAPQPQPQPQPQPAQPNCPKNEHFVPERTDNATGCTDKKGNLQCYSSRHYPCMGVHTRGRWRYQKMRGSRCIEVEEKAVRCEGPFIETGRCGSASTTMCGDEGTATSGIFVKSTRVQ